MFTSPWWFLFRKHNGNTVKVRKKLVQSWNRNGTFWGWRTIDQNCSFYSFWIHCYECWFDEAMQLNTNIEDTDRNTIYSLSWDRHSLSVLQAQDWFPSSGWHLLPTHFTCGSLYSESSYNFIDTSVSTKCFGALNPFFCCDCSFLALLLWTMYVGFWAH